MQALVIALLAISAIFLACILGSAIGALAGLMVGFVFDGSLGLLAKALGIPEAQPYQIGAMLGFVGGFFRATISTR